MVHVPPAPYSMFLNEPHVEAASIAMRDTKVRPCMHASTEGGAADGWFRAAAISFICAIKINPQKHQSNMIIH